MLPIFSIIKVKNYVLAEVRLQTTKNLKPLMRALRRWNVTCRKIRYDLRIPYNGCRGKKPRRV
jgi:ribosomal protein S11